jgi:DNA polymerase-3 subunit delta
MLYILHGPDDFSLREELGRIKNGLGDREALDSNTTFFEGKQVGLHQLMDACMALPFLGTHRLIIVEGLLSRSSNSSKGDDGDESEEKQGRKKGKGEWKALKDCVGGMPPSTVLVLVDGEVNKTTALYKGLAPLAEVKEFPLRRGRELREWIKGRVRQGGGTISSDAVNVLASMVGENLWVLASEIEKLLVYTAGRPIDQEDVEEVVSYARESNVFTMVDAIIEGRSARAASLLHLSLEEGAAPPYLLFMITRQLRLLVQSKELSMQRCRRADIKSQLGITKDFVLDKALEQGHHYSMERLEHVYRQLLETDRSIKRGLIKGEMALDLLIADLCA